MNLGRLVAAVFGPKEGENAQLGQVGRAAQALEDPFVFLRGQAVLFNDFRGDRVIHGFLKIYSNDSNNLLPSSPPKRDSEARSGWGMRPNTFPARLQRPAMFFRAPFGLASDTTLPSSSQY